MSKLPNALAPLPDHWSCLAQAFLHQAKKQPSARAIVDSTGVSLTYHQALLHAVALANLLRHRLGESRYVGVLLPPSAAAALANVALALLGKVAVNLNYTASKSTLDGCIAQCGISKVITSTRVLDRCNLPDDPIFLTMESLKRSLTRMLKIWSWSESELVPEDLLGQFLSGLKMKPNDTAAVLFTAGSTGSPKGVILTNHNILSNIHAIRQHANIAEKEVILGVAPFFHSFGYTLTLWAVLTLGHTVVYHHNPLDARTVADLCGKYKVSTIFCTPTIMRSYVNRFDKEQLKTLKICILGGEKLRPQLYTLLAERLSVVPLEGYGLTETSPVLCCNVPGQILLSDGRRVSGNKPGTVGTPLPGTAIKIRDIATGAELPPHAVGMIFARGPQIMRGYLNKPTETQTVLTDGWLRTGDLGFLDEEGFLTITGRISQFSKIAGEMVPHLAVEQEILKVTGVTENDITVTAVVDDGRGERLVVLYSKLNMAPQEVVRRLKASSLSPLWIPRVEDFVYLESLPTLSSGKIDISEIRLLAQRHYAS